MTGSGCAMTARRDNGVVEIRPPQGDLGLFMLICKLEKANQKNQINTQIKHDKGLSNPCK